MTALALAPARDLPSPIHDAGTLAGAYLAGFRPATADGYRRDLHRWFTWLAEHGVDPLQARRAHVEVWVRSMEEAGAAPASVGRRLSAVSGFYLYGEDEGLIDRSPLRRVRRPRSPDESPRLGVSRDQLRALLSVAEADGPRSHALMLVLGLLGTRISETLALDVEDFSQERGHQVVELRRKGGRTQRVPLAAPVAEALDRLIAGRETGPVFVTASGRRWDRHGAQKVVKRLARRAGVEHRISPHSLRHTFATLSLDAGAAIRDVQYAMGHRDPRTTMAYDRGRGAHDRHPTFQVAGLVAS